MNFTPQMLLTICREATLLSPEQLEEFSNLVDAAVVNYFQNIRFEPRANDWSALRELKKIAEIVIPSKKEPKINSFMWSFKALSEYQKKLFYDRAAQRNFLLPDFSTLATTEEKLRFCEHVLSLMILVGGRDEQLFSVPRAGKTAPRHPHEEILARMLLSIWCRYFKRPARTTARGSILPFVVFLDQVLQQVCKHKRIDAVNLYNGLSGKNSTGKSLSNERD